MSWSRLFDFDINPIPERIARGDPSLFQHRHLGPDFYYDVKWKGPIRDAMKKYLKSEEKRIIKQDVPVIDETIFKDSRVDEEAFQNDLKRELSGINERLDRLRGNEQRDEQLVLMEKMHALQTGQFDTLRELLELEKDREAKRQKTEAPQPKSDAEIIRETKPIVDRLKEQTDAISKNTESLEKMRETQERLIKERDEDENLDELEEYLRSIQAEPTQIKTILDTVRRRRNNNNAMLMIQLTKEIAQQNNIGDQFDPLIDKISALIGQLAQKQPELVEQELSKNALAILQTLSDQQKTLVLTQTQLERALETMRKPIEGCLKTLQNIQNQQPNIQVSSPDVKVNIPDIMPELSKMTEGILDQLRGIVSNLSNNIVVKDDSEVKEALDRFNKTTKDLIGGSIEEMKAYTKTQEQYFKQFQTMMEQMVENLKNVPVQESSVLKESKEKTKKTIESLQTQIADKQAQIERRKDELYTEKERYQALNGEKQVLQQQIKYQSDLIQKNEAEIEQLKLSLQKKPLEIVRPDPEQSKQIRELEESKKKLEIDLVFQEAKASSLNRDNEWLQSRITQAEARIKELENLPSPTKDLKKKIKEELKEKIAKQKEKRKNLESQFASLKDQLDKQTSQLHEAEKAAAVLKDRDGRFQVTPQNINDPNISRIQDLKEQLKQNRELIQRYEDRIREKDATIFDLQKDLISGLKKPSEREEVMKDINKDESRLEKKIERQRQKIDDLKSAKERAEKDLTDLRIRSTQEITELKSELRLKQAELNVIAEKLTERDRRITTIEDELKMIKNAPTQTNDQKSALSESLKNISDAMQKQIDNVKETVEEYQKSSKRLKVDTPEENKETELLMTKIRTLEEQLRQSINEKDLMVSKGEYTKAINKISEMQERLDGATLKIEGADRLNKELEEKLKSSSNIIVSNDAETKKKIEDLESIVKSSKASIQRYEAELKQKNKQLEEIASLKEENKQLHAKIIDREKQIKTNQLNIEELTKQRTDLEVRARTSERLLKELQTSTDSGKAISKQERKTLNTQIANLNNEKTRLEQEKTKATQRISDLEEEVKQYKDLQDQLTIKLTEQLDAVEKEKTARKELARLDEVNEKNSRELVNATKRINELEQLVESERRKNDRLSDIQNKTEHYKSKIQLLKNQIAMLNEENEEQLNKIVSMSDDIHENLSSEQKRAQKEIESLKKKIKEAEASVETTRNLHGDSLKRINQLQADINTLQAKCSEAEKYIDQTKDVASKLQTIVGEDIAVGESLRDPAEMVRVMTQYKETIKKENKIETDRLKTEIDKIRSDKAELQNQYDKTVSDLKLAIQTQTDASKEIEHLYKEALEELNGFKVKGRTNEERIDNLNKEISRINQELVQARKDNIEIEAAKKEIELAYTKELKNRIEKVDQNTKMMEMIDQPRIDEGQQKIFINMIMGQFKNQVDIYEKNIKANFEKIEQKVKIMKQNLDTNIDDERMSEFNEEYKKMQSQLKTGATDPVLMDSLSRKLNNLVTGKNLQAATDVKVLMEMMKAEGFARDEMSQRLNYLQSSFDDIGSLSTTDVMVVMSKELEKLDEARRAELNLKVNNAISLISERLTHEFVSTGQQEFVESIEIAQNIQSTIRGVDIVEIVGRLKGQIDNILEVELEVEKKKNDLKDQRDFLRKQIDTKGLTELTKLQLMESIKKIDDQMKDISDSLKDEDYLMDREFAIKMLERLPRGDLTTREGASAWAQRYAERYAELVSLEGSTAKDILNNIVDSMQFAPKPKEKKEKKQFDLDQPMEIQDFEDEEDLKDFAIARAQLEKKDSSFRKMEKKDQDDIINKIIKGIRKIEKDVNDYDVLDTWETKLRIHKAKSKDIPTKMRKLLDEYGYDAFMLAANKIIPEKRERVKEKMRRLTKDFQNSVRTDPHQRQVFTHLVELEKKKVIDGDEEEFDFGEDANGRQNKVKIRASDDITREMIATKRALETEGGSQFKHIIRLLDKRTYLTKLTVNFEALAKVEREIDEGMDTYYRTSYDHLATIRRYMSPKMFEEAMADLAIVLPATKLLAYENPTILQPQESSNQNSQLKIIEWARSQPRGQQIHPLGHQYTQEIFKKSANLSIIDPVRPLLLDDEMRSSVLREEYATTPDGEKIMVLQPDEEINRIKVESQVATTTLEVDPIVLETQQDYAKKILQESGIKFRTSVPQMARSIKRNALNAEKYWNLRPNHMNLAGPITNIMNFVEDSQDTQVTPAAIANTDIYRKSIVNYVPGGQGQYKEEEVGFQDTSGIIGLRAHVSGHMNSEFQGRPEPTGATQTRTRTDHRTGKKYTEREEIPALSNEQVPTKPMLGMNPGLNQSNMPCTLANEINQMLIEVYAAKEYHGNRQQLQAIIQMLEREMIEFGDTIGDTQIIEELLRLSIVVDHRPPPKWANRVESRIGDITDPNIRNEINQKEQEHAFRLWNLINGHPRLHHYASSVEMRGMNTLEIYQHYKHKRENLKKAHAQQAALVMLHTNCLSMLRQIEQGGFIGSSLSDVMKIPQGRITAQAMKLTEAFVGTLKTVRKEQFPNEIPWDYSRWKKDLAINAPDADNMIKKGAQRKVPVEIAQRETLHHLDISKDRLNVETFEILRGNEDDVEEVMEENFARVKTDSITAAHQPAINMMKHAASHITQEYVLKNQQFSALLTTFFSVNGNVFNTNERDFPNFMFQSINNFEQFNIPSQPIMT